MQVLPNPPPAIGDEPATSYKLIHEEFAAPPGRKELFALLERIISGGGVQKLVIKYGEPIKVARRVRADLAGEAIPEELVDDDLMSAVRNAEIEPFGLLDVDPFEYLFLAFDLLARKRLIPKAILVNRRAQLRTWLSVGDMHSLFGVDLFENKEMPDDVLLLVGAKADEPDVVVLSLRLEMAEPPKKSGKVSP